MCVLLEMHMDNILHEGLSTCWVSFVIIIHISSIFLVLHQNKLQTTFSKNPSILSPILSPFFQSFLSFFILLASHPFIKNKNKQQKKTSLAHFINRFISLISLSARPEDPITVSVYPKTLYIAAKKTARFVCKAKSPTYATLKWTKGQTGTLPPQAKDKDGILTIPSAIGWHTGTYTCTGSNQYSFDQISVQLRVAGNCGRMCGVFLSASK